MPVSRRCSVAGPAGAPTRVIGTSAVFPDAVSSVQMWKSRSNTIRSPFDVIDGQSTRPLPNVVIGFGAAPGSRGIVTCQMFSAPPRSDTKYNEPPLPHIGQRSFAPPCVTARQADGASGTVKSRSQISASSRWLWPCRHHWPDAEPRADIASSRPSGDAAEKNSLA